MSRIGVKPIPVPAGVSVVIGSSEVAVRGPKGSLKSPVPPGVVVRQEDSRLRVSLDGARGTRAMWGLARALLANAVTGVTAGFRKELDIVGVGYRARVAGRQVHFQLGYSHPIEFPLPAGIEVQVEKNTHIVVSGIDKQMVGEVAARIRSLRKPDPYKQKGIRYTGERLITKAGKTGACGRRPKSPCRSSPGARCGAASMPGFAGRSSGPPTGPGWRSSGR